MLKIKIITKNKTIESNLEANSIIMPTTLGPAGVLNNHDNMVILLNVGIAVVECVNEKRKYLIKNGVCKILNNSITLLCDNCETKEEINIKQAKMDKEKYQKEVDQIDINLGFVNELAETLAVVNRIQSAPIIISKNVSNNNSDNEILDINSIMADIDHPTNYFVRKKIMTSRTRIKSIKPYKSVIGEIDLSVQDKKIDRLVGNLNIVDTLPLKKVTGDGNINNDEILKTYEQKFSVPKSLDLASLQSKLVDTFKKLNDIQLAEDEKRKNEEILQQNNEIAKNTQESDNVNPDENESLQSLDEVNTRLAKTHTLKPKSFKIENLNEFEKVENLEEATSIEYSNDSKPIVEETEKSLTTEEVKSVEIHTTDVQIKKNDYSSNDSNESNIGVSAQIDDFYVIDYSKNNIKKMDSQPVVISQMTGVSDRLAQVIEREKKNNKKAKNTSVQQASSP